MELLFLPPENYYLFDKIESHRNIYLFKTSHDVEYKVIFKPSPYIFGEDKPYASLLYEFSVLAQFAGPQSYVRDDLIAPTVVAIFLDFYNQHDENVCFYICDSADGRQHVRKRKFDMWFNEYNRGAFLKLESEIKDTDGNWYPVAIIMKKDNVYRNDIAKAFSNLISGYNDDK